MTQALGSRKQQILDVASDLLRTRGFEAFSYQDLSSALGIKKASIHHHFPKKEDLGLALCQWTEAWLLDGLEHFEAKGKTSWDKLLRYAKAAQKHALNEQKVCPLSALHGDVSRLPSSMLSAMKKLDEIELNWIANVIDDGVKSKEFKIAGKPKAIAAMYIFSVKGALHYSQLHSEDLLSGAIEQFDHLLHG